MRFVIVLFFLLVWTSASYGQAGGEDCSTATVITGIPFTGNGNTSGANDDYAESCPDVVNGGGAPDHVYQYTTGATTEYLSFSLCQAVTDYDTQLFIYEGNCTSQLPIACMEDGCQSPAYSSPFNSEILDLALAPNTTYFIVIDGYNSSSSGNYQLNVTQGNPPPGPAIPFTDATSNLPTTSFHSGVAIGVSDMNADGLDDIIRLFDNDSLNIVYQQPGPTYIETTFGGYDVGDPWSVCIADANNDGYNDIIYADWGNVILLTSQNGTNYDTLKINPNWIFAQGSNFADIDNDGHLDAFVCHDEGTSQIFMNDQSGNLVYNTATIDLSTTPASDNSGNYSSIWTDYDDDGDIDMYLVKCRQGVTDNTDPRRINQLFINDGNGNYTENAAVAGIASGAQSWVSDFGDIDNDGDFDLIVLNHDVESELYLNNGDGTFTDIMVGSGLEGNLNFAGIQCSFRDFNNDGWVDLLAAGGEHRLFINNGNNTFTLDNNAFDYNTYWMESYAIGDLNNDGFLDIYGGYADLYNDPSTRDDKLWLNNGASGNNYVKFYLQGSTSNLNGIGAKVKIYGPWGTQVREVRSGEGYGIHNSFVQHFGVGTNTNIDSAEVLWPSGIRDLFYNLSPNQTVTVNEGVHTGIDDDTVPTVSVNVFPNPFSDYTTVQVNQNRIKSDLNLVLMDGNGRIVREYHSFKDELIIQKNGLGNGLYFYRITADGIPLSTGKIAVQD